MKFILRKILPEKHYINFEIWLIEHPGAFHSAFWLTFAILIFYFAFRPQPYVFRGYIRAEVMSIHDGTSDNGFSAIARVKLPDGSFALTSTRSITLASDAVETVCLETRELQNGVQRYLWVAQIKCAPD
ncbi:hypothetical protein [Cognatishimia activa]|uniref:Uncharacterized protein n=1 Tax=Cognatishimia activa TaxID=1715691 RepID=A0A0N7MBG8_9RHOB|nr:hypothetical protein [Cognatishimia activa]CUJ24206.1 hypothetical protein TA5113_02765 [Cognatishimia activa]CUK25368.1 hypothetical protein TA5114_01166 [Cognatishimia activa]